MVFCVKDIEQQVIFLLENKKIDSISKPKIIFFDWDGTLINSSESHLDIMNEVLEYFDHEKWNMDRFITDPTCHNREAFREFFSKNNVAAHIMFNDKIKELHDIGMPLFEETLELLDFCVTQNIKIYVISSHPAELLRKEINRLNCTKYFEKIVGSGDTARDKPNIDPILFALKEIPENARPRMSEMWFVGDAATDMHCARDFGCIGFRIGKPIRDDIMNLNNVGEFFQYLKSVCI
jgi:phosphoglycolate phosphatase